MKYLTTLEVARELKISKQTLLNWLYARRVAEPPRNKRGYRLWSASRVALVKRMIGEGRIHRKTIVHENGSRDLLPSYAREVRQFLADAGISPDDFFKELARLDARFRKALRKRF